MSWLLAGALGAAGLALLHVWTPSDDVRYSVCMWRRLLGLPCPGCGMTRALACLAKGDWRAAVALHPLAPLIAAELLLGWLAWGAGRFGLGGRLWRIFGPAGLPPLLSPLLLANLALLLALWVGRLAAGALPAALLR